MKVDDTCCWNTVFRNTWYALSVKLAICIMHNFNSMIVSRVAKYGSYLFRYVRYYCIFTMTSNGRNFWLYIICVSRWFCRYSSKSILFIILSFQSTKEMTHLIKIWFFLLYIICIFFRPLLPVVSYFICKSASVLMSTS